jgi:hypothetical protein
MQMMMQILDCFKLCILHVIGFLVQNCIKSLSLVMRYDALAFADRQGGEKTDDYTSYLGYENDQQNETLSGNFFPTLVISA